MSYFTINEFSPFFNLEKRPQSGKDLLDEQFHNTEVKTTFPTFQKNFEHSH